MDHLGGYVRKDDTHPFGDDWTYLPGLWRFLLDTYRPRTLVDLGCGEGHSTRWFLDHGVDAIGIDGSPEAKRCAAIPQDRFVLHDFRRPMGAPPRCDMVWSSEFVEHVDEEAAPNFMAVFAASKVVAMTHAFPGQGGHHHVHCRMPEYWIEAMGKIGFVLDSKATMESRTYAPTSHWERSGMIFTREVR